MIATAVTVPLVVILALLFGGTGASKPHSSATPTQPAALPPLTLSAPPSSPAAVAPCTKLIEVLPVALTDLPGRVVHPRPDSLFVVAWGNPAIVLRCGVSRPKALTPGSSAQLFSANGADGVYWLPVRGPKSTVWTTVDRAAYVELTVPNSYTQPPLNPIAVAVAKAMPRVCLPQAGQGQTPPPESQLCTNRK